MLNRDSEIVCSRFLNCELWSCDMNSTLGSVVPLAMFYPFSLFSIRFFPPSLSIKIDWLRYCNTMKYFSPLSFYMHSTRSFQPVVLTCELWLNSWYELRSLPIVDIIRRAKAQEQTVKMYKNGKKKKASNQINGTMVKSLQRFSIYYQIVLLCKTKPMHIKNQWVTSFCTSCTNSKHNYCHSQRQLLSAVLEF